MDSPSSQSGSPPTGENTINGKTSSSVAGNGAAHAKDKILSNEQTHSKEQPPAKPPPTQAQEIRSFFKTLAIFLVIAFTLRASVVEAFKIPSGSMKPTLQIGDYILVSKLSYGVRLPFMTNFLFRFAEPKRGDIVVFTRPDDPATSDDDSAINIIKRVMGLPGDTVEVRETKVYINNVLYQEPYARWDQGGLHEGNFGPERVPAGHIFLMGDNRDNSRDSRFWTEPFLDINRVKGRALIIYWTWDSKWLERIGKVIR